MVSPHNRILAVLKCDPYEQCFQQPIEFDFDSLVSTFNEAPERRNVCSLLYVNVCCVLVVSTLVLESRERCRIRYVRLL